MGSLPTPTSGRLQSNQETPTLLSRCRAGKVTVPCWLPRLISAHEHRAADELFLPFILSQAGVYIFDVDDGERYQGWHPRSHSDSHPQRKDLGLSRLVGLGVASIADKWQQVYRRICKNSTHLCYWSEHSFDRLRTSDRVSFWLQSLWDPYWKRC